MQLMDMIDAAGGINAIAAQVGLNEGQAKAGAAALLPALMGGFKKQAVASGGVDGISSMLQGAGGAELLQNVVSSDPTDVDRGQNLLGQLFGSKDVSRAVADHAAESSGINAAALKKMLPLLAMVAAGAMATTQQGAQANAGGLLGTLGGLFGAGSHTGNAGLASMLDLDGDGNPLDDIAGLAGKFFKH